NVEHGDSGGPALDDEGNIVGIVSFGLIDANNPGQTAFLQVSNNAKKLIRQQGIDTTPGSFEQAWTRAFGDYASSKAGHWHKAAQELSALMQHYKDFLAITPYLNYAQEQAGHESMPLAIPPGQSILWIAGLSLLFLVLLGIMLLIIFKRRVQVVPAAVTHFPSGSFVPSAPPINHFPVTYAPALPETNLNGNPVPFPHPGGENYVHGGYTSPSWYEQPVTPMPLSSVMETPGETPRPAFLTRSEQEISPEIEDTQIESMQLETSAAQPGEEEPENLEISSEEILQTDIAAQTSVELPVSNRNFSVPRRPSVALSMDDETEAVSGWADYSSELHAMITPCGHANTADVYFCRTCGMPVGVPEANKKA
ncbi:MAG TPA: trypsin-like serine protease, partial [Ktedonobacteraceae bacterium]|nr:trypsin-like serine protease [Ktedonobacteraceae bacterium]